MKTILYFNDCYIDTLSELRKLFKGNINDDLKRELLGSFRDGVIGKWLNEGDEECLKILELLKGIDVSLPNQMLLGKLKQVFINESIPSDSSALKLKFEDHCQIEKILYCKLDSKGNLLGTPEEIKNIEFKGDKVLSFRLFFRIKVTNPENDFFNLRLKVLGKKIVQFEEALQFSINTHKNEVKDFSIKVDLNEFRPNIRNIILFCDDNVIWRSIITGAHSVKLKFDSKENPFAYVEGSGDIKSFYIMKYVVVNNDMKPRTGLSYRDVNNYIEYLKRFYNLTLRLPTLIEWQYAAIGGVQNVQTMFAGGNDVDKVAWYNCNSSSQIHEVGKKAPNAIGLYDMSGNVWEMAKPVIGMSPFICGGAYNCTAIKCSVNSYTCLFAQDESRDDVGFRLVCDVDVMDNLDDVYFD